MDGTDEDDITEGKSVSVIGPNITITGNIEATGDPHMADLQIEGRVTGDIRCATVILTEGSAVSGSIFADRVRVSGRVDGGIDTKDLAVEPTARVSGDVIYDRLRVAAGGIVQGNMKCRAAEAVEGSRLKLVEASPAPAGPPEPKAVWID
ncbi:MAG TPA: polymer-forming cytoskeletal protein [Allosphingosinicella sp.]